MQAKKQQLEPDIEQQSGSKLGKEYVKAIYFQPAYLTCIKSTSWEMPGWMKHNLESRLRGEIPITSDMQMTPSLWQKTKRNYRVSWWRWKGAWKSWLKTQHSKIYDHGIWSHHSMANRWVDNGNSDRLIFLGSKIIADVDCRHEIKRCFFLGRKTMTNLDNILKSRDIILLTKAHIVKAMFFQ